MRNGGHVIIADLDSSLREQFLDVAKAEIEAEVEPDSLADHLRGKAVALERQRLHKNTPRSAA